MTSSPIASSDRSTPSIRPYLAAGAIGGAVALALNVALYVIGAAIAGGELLAVLPGATEPAPMPLVAVALLSIVPGIAAGAVYWGLRRVTNRPTTWMLAFAALAYLAFFPGPFNVASGTTVVILELMHVTTAAPILWFVLRARR